MFSVADVKNVADIYVCCHYISLSIDFVYLLHKVMRMATFERKLST